MRRSFPLGPSELWCNVQHYNTLPPDYRSSTVVKMLQALLGHDVDTCVDCLNKEDEIARLNEMLSSKALVTYPTIMPNQVRLVDKIAYFDKDRPWRTVTGTVIAFGWTGAGTFKVTFEPGWTWTDNMPPSEEMPGGYFAQNTGNTPVQFELDGDKKFRLLARFDW